MLSALFVFGASSFGNFEDAITNAIPLPSVTEILGIDNDFTDFLTGLVGTLYELLEDGIEAIVDLVLSIPSDDSFRAALTSQFSGCVISMFFIVSFLSQFQYNNITCLYMYLSCCMHVQL